MVKVSIIIATYNSHKILPMVLSAIKDQTYPRKFIEILLIDGGSTDDTRKIGKKFGARIINNPRTEPVYGKYLAYTKTRGRFVMYLDHDEVMQNKRAVELKVKALEGNSETKVIVGGGYENPKGYPFINEYINEFGDPFSFFIYRLSKRNGYFMKTMRNRYKISKETKDYSLFDLSGVKNLPIVEITSMGSMFDVRTLKKEFPETLKRMELLPHYFYLFYSKYPSVMIPKHDIILHYSADTFQKYFKKIIWRIKNNIFFKNMAESGFTGRTKYSSKVHSYKKYLFLPYAFSLVLPLLDAVYLAVTRRNINYLLHFVLILFTAFVILYYYGKYFFGFTFLLKNYDESKVVKV